MYTARMTIREPASARREPCATGDTITGSLETITPVYRRFVLQLLEQMEVHFDHRAADNGFSVQRSGLEAPSRHGLGRFLVQAQPQAPDHADVAGAPVGVHFDREHHHALVL